MTLTADVRLRSVDGNGVYNAVCRIYQRRESKYILRAPRVCQARARVGPKVRLTGGDGRRKREESGINYADDSVVLVEGNDREDARQARGGTRREVKGTRARRYQSETDQAKPPLSRLSQGRVIKIAPAEALDAVSLERRVSRRFGRCGRRALSTREHSTFRFVSSPSSSSPRRNNRLAVILLINVKRGSASALGAATSSPSGSTMTRETLNASHQRATMRSTRDPAIAGDRRKRRTSLEERGSGLRILRRAGSRIGSPDKSFEKRMSRKRRLRPKTRTFETRAKRAPTSTRTFMARTGTLDVRNGDYRARLGCPFLEARGNLEDASTTLSAHSLRV